MMVRLPTHTCVTRPQWVKPWWLCSHGRGYIVLPLNMWRYFITCIIFASHEHHHMSNHWTPNCFFLFVFFLLKQPTQNTSKFTITAAWLALWEGNAPVTVDSPHKWPVLQKVFTCHHGAMLLYSTVQSYHHKVSIFLMLCALRCVIMAWSIMAILTSWHIIGLTVISNLLLTL